MFMYRGGTGLETFVSSYADTLEGKYTIICGYEFGIEELVHFMFAEDGHTHHHNLVAANLEFNSAAHLLRTLQEHGEPDMSYIMIPAVLYECANGMIDEEWFKEATKKN